MGVHVIKLPDVGEGVAEAELVEWMVKPGDNVMEDQVLAAVMTDKATVEIPSPVIGKVIWVGAKAGEIVAVGSPIVRLEVDGAGNAKADEAAASMPAMKTPAPPVAGDLSAMRTEGTPVAKNPPQSPSATAPPQAGERKNAASALPVRAPRKEGEKPLASPAVRKRAADNGVDLRRVTGSGPAGRITHEDLDTYFAHGASAPAVVRGQAPDTSVKEIPVIGLRRKIAEKMTISRSRIPDIVYVEEVDMTALEDLRAKLNAEKKDGRTKLTVLPFLMRAMAKAIGEQPQLNSLYDDEAGIIRQYGGIHIGVAAQTEGGLVVPVVRHVEAKGLWECASEVGRLADAAKKGTATRDELSGSTITITSLGALGGIVTTPVINHPEVAIVGVNKMQVRPMWDGTQFVPRKMMNLSCAFDHRIIDGWNAAVFVQRVKTLMENPAMIFVE
ncbi:MAG: dihydrolipoamide acetyltransferase family protein [Parvularculaceae bacterium]|nr:dihydrolipoamide acetyltransferase family protein [Parvularculaceae bacterium]